MTYTDYVLAGRMLGRELKEKGCDYVIALTHMRTQNDIRSGHRQETARMLQSSVPCSNRNMRGIFTQPPSYQIQNKFRS